MKTAVLLIGFGGPRHASEIRPFLESVLEGVKIPEQRFNEVLRHYEAVGGTSPYNAAVESQRAALEAHLKKAGKNIPVFAAYRHSTPSFQEAFAVLKKDGYEKVIGFVLSPLRSFASFGKYAEKIEEAGKKAAAGAVKVLYTPPFYDEPGFVKAQSEKVKEALRSVPAYDAETAHFLFTAHSIPLTMDEEYSIQFLDSAFAVSHELGLLHWSVAYQSRSGNPHEPWLGPDVLKAVESLDTAQFKNVVVVPVGFACDNVELTYDLDIEVRKAAGARGLGYFRSSPVSDAPSFIAMMARQILGVSNVNN